MGDAGRQHVRENHDTLEYIHILVIHIRLSGAMGPRGSARGKGLMTPLFGQGGAGNYPAVLLSRLERTVSTIG